MTRSPPVRFSAVQCAWTCLRGCEAKHHQFVFRQHIPRGSLPSCMGKWVCALLCGSVIDLGVHVLRCTSGRVLTSVVINIIEGFVEEEIILYPSQLCLLKIILIFQCFLGLDSCWTVFTYQLTTLIISKHIVAERCDWSDRDSLVLLSRQKHSGSPGAVWTLNNAHFKSNPWTLLIISVRKSQPSLVLNITQKCVSLWKLKML